MYQILTFKQNNIAEIKIRAERRAGEMLRETKEKGERQTGHGDQKSKSHNVTPKLADIGINKSQSSRWQATASLPEEIFKEHIAETEADKKNLYPENITKKTLKMVYHNSKMAYHNYFIKLS